ncbi:MAG: arsenate reductase ArsC [Pseudomonadota bacterium]
MKLLFLCTHNRCRSVLAEAVSRQVCGNLIQVQSAGSQPARKVHPLTLEHLALHDISVRGLRSKSLDTLADYNPDFVITVCDNAAAESCPLWDGNAIRIHWSFKDPSLLDGDDFACGIAFATVIATLSLRMSRIKELLQRNADKLVLAEEFSALANCFVMASEPSRREPLRPMMLARKSW